MDDKKYICIKDYQYIGGVQTDSFFFGTVKTIDEWKQFLLDDRKKALLEVFSSTDDEFINEMNEYLNLKGLDVINIIQDLYEIRIVAFEDAKYQYFIEDTDKFVTEKDVRKMLLEEELDDVKNNMDDYLEHNLGINHQCNCIKLALYGDIEEVIDALGSSWNIPIKKLY